MARKTDGPINLTTKTARAKLPAKKSGQYTHGLGNSYHLAYRKRNADIAGRWYLQHNVGNVPTIRSLEASADDFTEADGVKVLSFVQAMQKALAMMAAKPVEKTENGPLTVADVVGDWLTYMDKKKKSGAQSRKRAEAHILPPLGHVRVDRLTTDQLEKWHYKLAEGPKRIRTVKGMEQAYAPPPATEEEVTSRRSNADRVLRDLKAALNRAFENQRVSDDSAWRRVKAFKADRAREDFFSKEEAVRLVNACPPDFRKLVLAGMATGCRHGELCNLKVKDFQTMLSKANGENEYEESGHIFIRTSKSGKPRYVHLSDAGIAFFKQVCLGRSAGETLLVRDDGQPWKPSQQVERMYRAMRAANVYRKGLCFHSLRHTWASHAVMDGMPLMLVAQNLGHKDTRMVEAHYGHLAADWKKKAFKAHAPSLGGPVEQSNVVAMKG